MIGTTTALILGGLAAGGAIGGGAIASSAAKSAAKTQAEAASEATKLQREMYEQGREDIAPWRETGELSLDRLQTLLGLSDTGGAGYGTLATGPTNIEMDPGYQFRITEGLKGIERSAAARTGTLSGAAAKEMARFSQDFASGEYGTAWNRARTNQLDVFNRLASLAQLGQQSATTTAGLGTQTAGQIGQNIMGAANATAAGQVGSANAWAGTLGGLGSNLQNMLLLQQMLSKSGYQPSMGPG